MKEEDIDRFMIYGPYDVFDKGNYHFTFRFEKTFFVNQLDNCLKLEIFSQENGMLAETFFTHNDLQKIGKQIDFDVILNSLASIDFRVMPMCKGEIVFSKITFQKKNISN